MSLFMFSCTENSRVKNWGGKATLNLPAGQKLMNVTWKEGQLWYVTRPMKSTDSVETYQFQEESGYGIMEGNYTIIEKR